MGLGLELTVVPRQNGPRKMITENNKDYLSLSLSPSPPPPSPPVIKQGIYFSRRALGRRQLLRFSCCAEQAGGVLGFILGVGGGELGGQCSVFVFRCLCKKRGGERGLAWRLQLWEATVGPSRSPSLQRARKKDQRRERGRGWGQGQSCFPFGSLFPFGAEVKQRAAGARDLCPLTSLNSKVFDVLTCLPKPQPGHPLPKHQRLPRGGSGQCPSHQAGASGLRWE